MFERFDDGARSVVVLAHEEARLLNHNYVGTEHMLLGLIRQSEGVASRSLAALGASHEAVRDQLRELVGRGTVAPPPHMPFTSRAKKGLELSLDAALELDDFAIGTEHLLLGLLREGEGTASHILTILGADGSAVRERVLELREQTGAGAPTTTPAGWRLLIAVSGVDDEVLTGVKADIDAWRTLAGLRVHVREVGLGTSFLSSD